MSDAYVSESAPRRNVAIDGLRGVAALSVAFYHSLLHFDTAAVQRVIFPPLTAVHGAHDLWLKLLLAAFNGEYAVVIFFILSGLVLTRSLERLNDRSALAVAFDFTVKRACRVYPAVFACIAFMFVLTAFPALGLPVYPSFSVIQLLKGAALWDVGVHGPMWTLQVEVCAVPFMLVAYLLRRSLGVYAAALAFFYAFAAMEYPVIAWNYSLLAGSLIGFASGMVIGLPGVDRIFRAPGKTAAVALLLYFFLVRQVLGHESSAAMLTQVGAGAVLVGVLFYSESPLSRLLSSRVPQFLGRISYSFYLLNVPVLGVIWAVLDNYVPASRTYTITAGLFAAVCATVIGMPLSALSERYVERAGIRLGRWLTNWKQPGRSRSGLSKSA